MASKSGSGGLREPPNEQAVLNHYESMRSELSQIYSNITELEMQVSEHSLVINAIQPLDQSRKCFRMIGGVLVERTIKEVLPAVQRNKDGLEEVVKKLYKTLEKKKNELTEFEAKYKIRIRKQDDNKEEGNKKEAITVEDIENFLHESLLLSFNTEIEDGSIEEVAEQLIILHEEHLRGSH